MIFSFTVIVLPAIVMVSPLESRLVNETRRSAPPAVAGADDGPAAVAGAKLTVDDRSSIAHAF